MKPAKYYQVTVTMKNGFVYSYTCIGRMLEGLKKNSQSYWTDKIEVVEISSEEYEKKNEVVFDEEEPKVKTKNTTKAVPATKEAPKKIPKEQKVVGAKPIKTKPLRFSNLEDFFDSSEPAPKNKKLKKRV